ncbi:MAG: hypothetical protein RLZZ156_1604 [Deinococcota bacterium]|jgi:signal transduction histidine kinase
MPPSGIGLRQPNGAKQFKIPIWVQLSLLLGAVAIVTFVVLVIVAEVYWLGALRPLEPLERELIERIRPAPRHFIDFLRRPAFWSVLLSLGFVIAVSILIARRLLLPLQTLERSIKGNSQTAQGTVVGRIEELARQLEQSEKARQIANAAIAHELRTPLSNLRARVEGIEYGIYPLSMPEIVQLHPQLDVLEHLITDLQTLSLADAGQLKLNLEPTDLLALLKTVVLETKSYATIQGTSTTLLLDQKRIRQVLYNLLENAKHYAPNKQVEIELSAKPNQIHLMVMDHGVGVPEEALEQLFTPFYRLEPSRSRLLGGSGLGLAVVQAIVVAHGGSVWAERGITGGLAIQILINNSKARR